MSESEDLTNIRLSSVIIEDTNNDIETGYISDKINNQKNQKYKSILISKNNDIENINKFKINLTLMLSAEAPKKLFLLDAYALIYRAYFAFVKNPRINSRGENTSAAFGFTNDCRRLT